MRQTLPNNQKYLYFFYVIFVGCNVSSLYTEGPYSVDKTFYYHEETINVKCDEDFQLSYEPYGDDYSGHKAVFVNDLQIYATCFHGKIYLNESIELFQISCRPSSYFYSCI